jgi:hypothetical protein
MRPETASRVIFQACMEIIHHQNPNRLIKCKKYLQSFRDQMEHEYKEDGYDIFKEQDNWRSSFYPSFNELYYISDRWRAPHRICYLLNTIDYIQQNSMEKFSEMDASK